ncbi:hypothetical protein [Halosegnis sp.]|uniref:hypothetical protein n=1 Tax=Halosegnis sp. TaxID=2864959 RepID=UPI0035D446DE
MGGDGNRDHATFISDSRGVSTVIGALFVFSFIVIGLTVNQATVVPQENREVEFNHYVDEVQTDMVGLRSQITSIAGFNGSRSTTVDRGVQYPARVIAINPPPATGHLQQRLETQPVVISESGTGTNLASEVCGGSSTYGIQYNPDYANLDAQPIHYENGQVYARDGDTGNVALLGGSAKTIIDTDRKQIDIYRLVGTLPTSASITPVTVQLEGSTIIGEVSGKQVNEIRLPTELPESVWQDELVNGSYAGDISASGTTVTISSIPSDYEIRCFTIGVGGASPPGVDAYGNDFVTDDGGRGGDTTNSGAGTGGISNYENGDNPVTFSTENGLWKGITCTDQMRLSDGKPASKPNGNNLQGEVIRIAGTLTDNKSESYTVDVKLARATDGSWNKKQVKIYDGNGNSDSATLTASAATAIYDGSEIDIFESSNYNDPSTGTDSFTNFVDRIQQLEEDAPVTWQTSRMTGRVTVAFECDSPPPAPATGVETVDGSAPDVETSTLSFDLQVANGESKTVTDISVSTPGNQNSAVNGIDKLKRPSSPEVELEPRSTDGANQTGTRATGTIKLDGSQYALDTDATFENGVVLDASLRALDNGNTKIKYDLADSASNADITVTFYFADGTAHEVYLRVTNVNS